MESIPVWARVAVAFTLMVVSCAATQSLYSDVSRGRPFWSNFLKLIPIDAAAFAALGIVVSSLIWAIDGLVKMGH